MEGKTFNKGGLKVGSVVYCSLLGRGVIQHVCGFDGVVGYSVLFDAQPPMYYNGGFNPCFVPVYMIMDVEYIND